MVWEYRPYAEWLGGLASFSRLILHDRRGTGASSRNVAPPNLETRVADLRAVLDAVGSERTVLGGTMEGGGPNVLFAGSDPERVQSIVWWYPAPRTTRAPDYPYGADDALLERATRDIRDSWGTDRYGMGELEFITSESTPFPWGRFCRQSATPDVALEMDRIYNETDVRGAMPAITAPVLLMARERDRAALEYYASLLRQPTIRLFPGQAALKGEEIPRVLEAIRGFVGIEVIPELDTFLSTVLCELMDGKIGGITVSIGARVAAKASASEVLVSQTVKDLVAGSGLVFEDRGEHELKGLPDRWRLYSAALD